VVVAFAVDCAPEVVSPVVAFFEVAVACGYELLSELSVSHELEEHDFFHDVEAASEPVRRMRDESAFFLRFSCSRDVSDPLPHSWIV
jgi:hypothetical protein